MNPKYIVAIVTAIFAASTYAAGTGDTGSGMSGGKPAANGATNDMDSTNPNKGLPKDSTQERGGHYKEKSSKSKSRSGSGSESTYHRGSGTDRGTEGPGSGSKNKD